MSLADFFILYKVLKYFSHYLFANRISIFIFGNFRHKFANIFMQ
jgi:hypothetical protein